MNWVFMFSFKLYLYGIEILKILDECCRVMKKFKLYLYGIEIRLILLFSLNQRSSNCTFMELKYNKGIKEFINALFKLYLYGIEILYCGIDIVHIVVFKLYLYGIEMW